VLATTEADDEGWLLAVRPVAAAPGQTRPAPRRLRLTLHERDAETHYWSLHDAYDGALVHDVVEVIAPRMVWALDSLTTVERHRLTRRGHEVVLLSWTTYHHRMTYRSALWSAVVVTVACARCGEQATYRGEYRRPVRAFGHRGGRLLGPRRCRGRLETPEGSVALFDRGPCRGGTLSPVLVRWRV